MILRFRDLVTSHGETIKQHADLAKSKKAVWWGWWNKAGECVPTQAFGRLKDLARRKNGLSLLLFDSGQECLYRATATDLHWDPSLVLTKSPSPPATPAYYRSQKYFGWFKLESIDPTPLDPTTVNQYTYVDVDEFFSPVQPGYKAFDGKQVSSLNELTLQNRTIWFVRPFRNGDTTHQISLLDAKRLDPADFPAQALQTRATTLLWVSDLHFGAEHGFPLESEAARRSLGHAVENAVKELATEHRRSPDIGGVLVSGDITWTGSPAEFTQAKSFFQWTGRWTALTAYHFAICPGNHDVAFSKDPTSYDTPVSVAAPEAQAAFSDFYQSIFYRRPNEYLSSGRRFLLGNASVVEVVMLNSSLLSNVKGAFQGHGFLGHAQLEHAATAMEWKAHTSGRRAFRIVVLHHHILPVTYRDLPITGAPYSVVLDAEALLRWAVDHRVDLILHGHMHQPFYSRITRPVKPEEPMGPTHEVAIIGMGSAGVKTAHLGEIARNVFGLIEFGTTAATVTLVTIHPTNTPQQHWTINVPYRTMAP